MKLPSLAKVNADPECAKCLRRCKVQRHHKGSEAMWVRHFKETRAEEPKYLAFAARYLEYHPDDCVNLCGKCHLAIHELYYRLICDFMDRKAWGPCHSWTWRQAEALMKKLRSFCDKWLESHETPR